MRPPAPSRPLLSLALFVTSIVLAPLPASADDPPQKPDGPMVKLLKSGRVPEERQGTVVEMIGRRGSAADLDYLFGRALRPDGFSNPIRLKAFEALAEAESTRHVRPDGDLARLVGLISPKEGRGDTPVRSAAIRLAGLWKVESLGDDLRAIALDPKAGESLRGDAIDALASIGGGAGRKGIEDLAATGQPVEVRMRAVAALARIDLEAAIAGALAVIKDASPGLDLSPMLAALLSHQGGADRLATAIGEAGLPADAARLALRALYAIGRSDAGLVAELTKAAGIDAEVKPLDKDEMERLVAEVAAKGDPERGEDVFRRADLNCAKCHALAGAGGGIGPELSAVGASSPVDYLVNSIMVPDQAIKEEFHTLVVLTAEGQVFQGIVADRDDRRIVLKEATGELRTIPTAEVEDQREGGSLMPRGLVNFLTRAELVDLLRFLSELGKPGPFAIRTVPAIQRWRVLGHEAGYRSDRVPDAPPDRWRPAFAKVSGRLPLADLVAETKGPVLDLQGEVEASAAGKVEFRLDSAQGVRAWLDDRPLEAEGDTFPAEFPAGRHKLTLRVDTAGREARALKVEVVKPSGSTAEFVVVGGR